MTLLLHYTAEHHTSYLGTQGKTMTDSLTLHFEGTGRIELARSEFKQSESKDHQICIRGKTPGAFSACGSFQWTSAVRAVCAIFIRFALSERNNKVDYCLIGGKGSLAASLDYALSKGPAWIQEMFGGAGQGDLYAKRLFRITNPNRKRPGPVALSVNRLRISGETIKIILNGKQVEESADLYTILIAIEEQGIAPTRQTVKTDAPKEMQTANS